MAEYSYSDAAMAEALEGLISAGRAAGRMRDDVKTAVSLLRCIQEAGGNLDADNGKTVLQSVRSALEGAEAVCDDIRALSRRVAEAMKVLSAPGSTGHVSSSGTTHGGSGRSFGEEQISGGSARVSSSGTTHGGSGRSFGEDETALGGAVHGAASGAAHGGGGRGILG